MRRIYTTAFVMVTADLGGLADLIYTLPHFINPPLGQRLRLLVLFRLLDHLVVLFG